MSQLESKVEGISHKSSVALESVQKLESDMSRLQSTDIVALQASERDDAATCILPKSPQLPPPPPLPPATTKKRRPHLLAKEAGDGGDSKELMARLARLEGIVSGTALPVQAPAHLASTFQGDLQAQPSLASPSRGELILTAAGGNNDLGGQGCQKKLEDSTTKLQEDSLWVHQTRCTHLFVARVTLYK